MKTTLKLRHVIILCLAICLGCSKDSDEEDKIFLPDLYTYVPDDNFERLLIQLDYDDEMDNYVLTSNIKNIKKLNAYTCYVGTWGGASCGGYGIKDLTGIKKFESLESLDIRDNQLSNLDLSYNTNLKFLNCSGNYLTSLDLSNNTELTYLALGDFFLIRVITL